MRTEHDARRSHPREPLVADGRRVILLLPVSAAGSPVSPIPGAPGVVAPSRAEPTDHRPPSVWLKEPYARIDPQAALAVEQAILRGLGRPLRNGDGAMSDYVAVNRANWDSRVPHHLAAYGLELFADDPEHLSGVVRFDRPRLGSVEGLDVVHLLESPFGAAWLRTHAEFAPGYVGEPVAQLAIAGVPTHRGRGWGRRLLERLLEEADKNGLSEVQLTVGLANVPAVRLYESTGFSTIRSDGLSARMRRVLREKEGPP